MRRNGLPGELIMKTKSLKFIAAFGLLFILTAQSVHATGALVSGGVYQYETANARRTMVRASNGDLYKAYRKTLSSPRGTLANRCISSRSTCGSARKNKIEGVGGAGPPPEFQGVFLVVYSKVALPPAFRRWPECICEEGGWGNLRIIVL